MLVSSHLCVDINEFYTYTLEDNSKNVSVKTAETCHLAERWESVSPPVPAATIDIAKKTLNQEVWYIFAPGFMAFSSLLYFCYRLEMALILEKR